MTRQSCTLDSNQARRAYKARQANQGLMQVCLTYFSDTLGEES